jgi:hypothetical protein
MNGSDHKTRRLILEKILASERRPDTKRELESRIVYALGVEAGDLIKRHKSGDPEARAKLEKNFAKARILGVEIDFAFFE